MRRFSLFATLLALSPLAQAHGGPGRPARCDVDDLTDRYLAAFNSVEVLHIRDGRIAEIWNYADVMGLAAQLRAADPLALRIEPE